MGSIFEYINSVEAHPEIVSVLKHGDYSRCKSPIISVIMPVYKRPELLRKAIKSVLDQDASFEFEVVIVDNYDEDISPNYEIARSFNDDRIFYYQNEKNLGMYGNFNRGILLARGKYISFCHDDDLFPVNALSTLYKIKKENNKECIIGENTTIDMNDNITSVPKYPCKLLFIFRLKEYFKLSMFDLMVKCPGNGGGGCLFDKEVLVSLGGFNELLFPGCDYALILNYAKKYGAVQTPLVTYNYRIGDNCSFEVAGVYAQITKSFHLEIRHYVNLPKIITNFIVFVINENIKASCSEVWKIDNNTKKTKWCKIAWVFLNRIVKIKAYL